ncbi:MAG: Na+/H+ antiporter [Chloroflexi bacterium RBG_16_58_14]|nr:MAG: Na+/H+ antiporter [Chloroflexi bacterium RBG_16_58_14]
MRTDYRLPVGVLAIAVLSVSLTILLSACTVQSQESLQQRFIPQKDLLAISTPLTSAQGEIQAVSESQSEEFIFIEEIIILMLVVAVVVGIVANRLRVPYTIGLVLIGLLLTLRGTIVINVSSTLILALLVPPLIFEAAFHLNINDLRKNWIPILVLAIPGVILTTLVVGGIVSLGTGLALPIALVFGAIVSATDPISVVALFRKMGVPKRLRVLLEGESLFNDGTAIVVFELVLAMALAGVASFNFSIGLTDFVLVAGGGLVVGLLLGSLVSGLIMRIDDYLIETTLTSVLAFGSYLVAEALGFSGVLAVVAAGLVNGNIGPRGMSPTTRIVVINFWEYAAFLANTFIFLLIGLQVDLPALFGYWQFILWAIAAVLVARLISIYGLSRLEREIPLKWQHVLYWGGLRGAISLALVLSLPGQLASTSNQLRVMTFGVVLFTLIVQGLTMKPLVRRLGIIERRTVQQDEYEHRHARAVISRAGFEHLQHRRKQGMLSDHTWKRLSPVLDERLRSLQNAVREVIIDDPSVEAEELDTARREYYRAQRSAISSLMRDNVITEDTYRQLVSEIDAALVMPHGGWSDLLGSLRVNKQNVDRLICAMIQEQDVENAVNALTKVGITVTQLPSSGAALSRRNATLLVGLSAGQEASIVQALQRSCRKRVEYLTALPAGFPGEMSAPIPVTVGGATIFTFIVERFEVM